jgi:nucleoside transporter
MANTNQPIDEMALPSMAALRGHWTLASRLSVMMLLEFAAFGSWFATLGLVLATHKLASIIGPAYLLSAVAAIVSPMFFGALGDAHMRPKNVLAITHLLGGLVMLGLPQAVESANAGLTLGLVFLYMVLFQPTLGLVNSIALRQLGSNQGIFPFIRVFAPLGWVVGGLTIGALDLSASTGIFQLTAAWSFVFAVYAFTLDGGQNDAQKKPFSIGELIGARAFVLFRDRDFTVLMICALLTSISLGIYNAFSSPFLAALGIKNVAGVLAIGQMSEVLFIVTIPAVMVRIGMKWSLLLGMGMWGIRFVLFALAPQHGEALAVVAVGLHGICNDFFLVISAMFIHRLAPAHLAVQAQSWLILMISGFGAAIGSALGGSIFGQYVIPNAAQGGAAWAPMWIAPIVCAVVTALIWIVFFRGAGAASSARTKNAHV